MKKKIKIKRERVLITVSAFLAISAVGVAVYLTGILGKSLNEFLSTEGTSVTPAIEFNFDTYEQLDL